MKDASGYEIPDWATQEVYESYYNAAVQAALAGADRAINDFARRAVRNGACESPIELKLLGTLRFMSQCGPLGVANVDVHTLPKLKWEDILRFMRRDKAAGRGKLWSVEVHPQVQIGAFRVDMAAAVVVGDDLVKGIVIECDGHDYHYNTKRKVAKDRERDRLLQQYGFKVMRFPGSEIHREPKACAYEVLHACEWMMQQRYFGESEMEWASNPSPTGDAQQSPRDVLGPPPGHKDCAVPASVVAEFDLLNLYDCMGKQIPGTTLPWSKGSH